MDSAILELLKRSAAIPSMPQVATRFLEIVQEPDFDFKDVVEVLSTDPGTASEILRLANSSLFGITRQVTSLVQALPLLGIKRVRSLVLGRYIVDSINQKSNGRIDRSYYWRRSVTTAILSARLADALAPKLREEAFISGLLADIGVMVLDDAMPERYRPIAEQYQPGGNVDLAQAEQTLLDSTHAEVSAVVLEHWQLPEVICEAVRHHPWESRSEHGASLANIVGSSDRIAKYLCERPADIEVVLTDCQKIVEELDLDPAVLADRLQELEVQIRDFAELLHVELIHSKLYELIATEIRQKMAGAGTATG